MAKKMSKAEADYAAYLKRSADTDKRIAAGESMMDILRSRQLEQGKAAIARIMEQERQDRED